MRLAQETGFTEARVEAVGGVFWAAASFFNAGVRLRPLQIGVTALCGALESATSRVRSYDATEKFALGYFLRAKKS